MVSLIVKIAWALKINHLPGEMMAMHDEKEMWAWASLETIQAVIRQD